MITNLYERLKRGESLRVRTLPCGSSPGGLVFTVHPAYWDTLVLGFSLEIDGRTGRKHHGEVFDREKMEAWSEQLEEVTDGASVEWPASTPERNIRL